jgi:hypothetical protein
MGEHDAPPTFSLPILEQSEFVMSVVDLQVQVQVDCQEEERLYVNVQ